METILRDHDASRQAITELFKFTEIESEQIIEKMRQQVRIGFIPSWQGRIFIISS